MECWSQHLPPGVPLVASAGKETSAQPWQQELVVFALGDLLAAGEDLLIALSGGCHKNVDSCSKKQPDHIPIFFLYLWITNIESLYQLIYESSFCKILTYFRVGMNCSCGLANSKEFPKIVRYTKFIYTCCSVNIRYYDYDQNGLKSWSWNR